MAGAELGPLHGLPLGVKDLNDLSGVRTTQGSRMFEDVVPDRDDNIVASMRLAGAIAVGKTNVPEHGFGATTSNPLFGHTGNPYDPMLSAGASTGGGAAALAARMVPLAIGSDFAGSLRTPASFCGIAGMRPSSGTVASGFRGFGWSPFDVEGPLARTAADALLVLSVLAGAEGSDPLAWSRKADFQSPVEKLDLSRLRIAVSEDLGFAPMSIAVRDAFKTKLDKVADMFGSVSEACPDMRNADRAFLILRGIGFVHDFGRIREESPDGLSVTILDELERAETLTIRDIGWAMAEQTRIYRSAESFFDKFDLLITPAASVAPFAHEEVYPRSIDGEEMGGYLRWEAISYGVTLFAGPSVVVPCGMGPGGMPMGLQLVSRARSDAWLLNVAHTMERCFNGISEMRTPLPSLISD